jgi:hypothetical protein
MSFLFWGFTIAMMIAAIGFIAVPLKTGKSLFKTPGVMVIVFVPLLAMAMYSMLGSPNHLASTQDSLTVRADRSAAAANDRAIGSVESMVDGLRQRLDAEPNDAEGWILLARSYQHIGQPTEALAAYERAKALGKIDTDLEVLLLGASVSKTTDTSGPVLRGKVTLSAAAAKEVLVGDSVFIFAKESREHRMPVVALRKNVSDLPFEFQLTDKEVMIPGRQLSDFQELIVTAKVSRTGNASDNSLGLETWSEPVSPTSAGYVELVIDSSYAGNDDE